MHRGTFCRAFLIAQRFKPLTTPMANYVTGYSEVSMISEDLSAEPPLTVSTLQKSFNQLKPMLKTNPSDLERNNARRALCTMSNQIHTGDKSSIVKEPIDASNVALILHGIFHTASLPTPTLGNNKSAIDLTPLYDFLEYNFWNTSCSHWKPSDLSDILKICNKISSVPIVSVLASLMWPIINAAPKMKANEVVLVARSFHTFGIKHPRLHFSLMTLAKSLEASLSADDMNRILVSVLDESTREDVSKLLKTLMTKATKNVKTLTAPTVSRCVNILVKCGRKFPLMKAEMKTEINDFQDLLYTRAVETVACAPVADAVEICANFSEVIDKERFMALFKLTAERVTALSQNIKPKHIAMLFRSCQTQKLLDENLFNVLAEKCCGQLKEFDESEIADVVESLASFDLYDAELFTMVASRFAQQTRDRELLDPLEVTRVLQAFAKLKEKNDALLFAGAQQYAISLYSLSKETMEAGLAVFKQFEFNHRDIIAQFEGRMASLEEGLSQEGSS